MKDFFVDPFQVELARALGADGLLLIAALGDRPLLEEIRAAARELGLEVLVEVHDARECELAHRLGPELSGVNNRDLSTFEVDLGTSERLRPYLPPDSVALAESGIRTRVDVERLEKAGFDALLVGESLMRANDPGDALLILRGADREDR
jgi:indole-3-glycerol phosphate synthase